MGGMFGESKYNILKKIPAHLIPKTILIKVPVTSDEVFQRLKDSGFTFPLIFKPELGERGFMVKRIQQQKDIHSYLLETRTNFLVQELVDLPLEFGVFYTRFPNSEKGQVTSVVMKEMLAITGDGKSTIEELIFSYDRAKLQWEQLKKSYQHQLRDILPAGTSMELVSIGNHALGTKFLDGSHLINEQLSNTFDHISKQIEGFYFGRFDLRCASIGDLYNGKIKILELNGCGAEPAHIYHPGYSLLKAVNVLFVHWRNIFVIARQNQAQGVKFISFTEGRKLYKKFKAVTK